MVPAAFLLLLFAQNSSPDARELLARGIQLIPSKPAEAVKALQQALRIDPDLPDLRYELGLAYHAIGDEGDAEPELRDAAARTPDSAPVHNYLGIVLFQLGNAKAALEEFRTAGQLAPKDPNAHFNLGEALARTGDSTGALNELRVAAGLAPSDAGLTRLMKNVENALAAPESTIKVDVRQVLVPVVVTDKDGHHLNGLKQSDFRIFEDGVEQKITGFSVESAALPATAAAAPPATPAPAAASPSTATAHVAIHRTYMVLLDTLHMAFNDFTAARDALVKLFRQEHSEDSQYVVVAIGASAQVVLNITSDTSAVLAALESKRMQKVFQDGQIGGLQADLSRFRRDLTDTRRTCDALGSPPDKLLWAKCQAGLDRAPQQAQAIAEEDRGLTIVFLRQFRSLVAQLARGRDRRTIILVSNGFQIIPGKEALDVLEAFFPLASHCLVQDVISCLSTGREQGARMADEFDPILQLAAGYNITIDTIDSRGLYGLGSFDASVAGTASTIGAAVDRADRAVASANGNTLAEIAEATGGTAFHDSNNLLAGLQRAFADGRDYYTLGYISSNPALDGKFRKITVQLRDSSAAVNAKRGYWAVAQ